MKKILIVDDDIDIVECISFILGEGGYETQSLSKGLYLSEKVNSFQPDLILLDIMLAGTDGRVLCAQLKKDPTTCRIPVIMISASHNIDNALLQEGAPDDFIAKPFDIDYLLKKVQYRLAA